MGIIFSPYFLLYLALSVIIATLGYRKKLGFWGYLFASLLLTPLMGLLLVIVTDKRPGPA
ncbi:hypothetical protein JCM30471_29400 [Desulfuromonas carbonis]|uniref:hypothetical protein n=1 Tax=Desulfuromonas sp. DDH964 TaxID=1823759 RepID=UPI00078C3CEF|nr:hypothetical protein [Desulfuromonas sp. DDH964]AMV71119.1 hypothetical protein DBW_0734 [Desulfuromonas sp. DDH964]